VLTKGDPAQPKQKGAVLRFVNRFSHATLYARNTTASTTLKGEQEILYITGGKGSVTAGTKTAELRDGIFVLIPEAVPFSLTNTGTEPLTLYLISEPVTKTFKPQNEILVRDEYAMPFSSSNGHWSMIIRTAFNIVKELSIIEYVNVITFDPMTIGHPHAHLPGCEEVWTALEGTSLLFLGKQLRHQPPGTAYLCPPYGDCTHSNINSGDKPVKFLYFAVRQDWEKNDGIQRTVE
jgi:mannose-6-phosphate isomerase-like protein (cupin superfamily)